MSVTISIIISLLALLAAFYQAHLQRVHNRKSVKPLGQIYFWDDDDRVSVQILNNGLGPLIIDRLTFKKRDNIYSSIKNCVDLDPKSYMHPPLEDTVQRVVLPNGNLTVFETVFERSDNEEYMNRVRQELSSITLNVQYHDIYDNTFTVERGFNWFTRHAQNGD